MIGPSKVLMAGAGLVAATLMASGAQAGVLYDNGTYIGTGHEAANSINADDFTLTEGSVLTGATISIFETGANEWDGTVHWYIYADASGKPGATIASGFGSSIVEAADSTNGLGWVFSNVSFDFGQNIPVLGSTRYWFGLHLSDSMGDNDGVNWAASNAGQVGVRSKRSVNGTGAWQNNFFDMSFRLVGEPVPTPGALALMGIGCAGLARRRR